MSMTSESLGEDISNLFTSFLQSLQYDDKEGFDSTSII
jgi:phage protein D